MKLKRIVFFGTLLFFAHSLTAQINFNRGVNLTNWFQAGSARQIQFTKFTKQDFINIKSLGCDVVRLPINLHFMTNGAPDYIIDPLFFEFLDKAADWAEDLHMNLILDNHTFDPATNTDPNVGAILIKVWKQMAVHYKDRSEYILYEILNEPHGITTQQWGQIQKDAIDAIREVDSKHTIIVGASGFNTYSEMKNLPVYADTKLIYTFHFYDPFVFTHQGASWVNPTMEPLAGVPFPYNSAEMPACPPSLKDSWIEGALNNYAADGTVAKVKSLIDIAVSFKTSRNVKVFCGEFGVYIPNSLNNDRVYWYEEVRKYLEEKEIPWTIWDYTGSFGLFKKGSNEMFDYDLNTELLQALNLTVPEQKVYQLRPDSVGFSVYSDAIEKNIVESGSSSGGTIDFYNASQPNNDKYSLYWGDAAQYGSIGFDFKPDKDLSKLVSDGYALDFMVRGTSTTAKFDVRFIDSKTSDPADHPWRMRYTIDNNFGPWDRYWHHVHIPLSGFIEQGSWDNDNWFNPEGKFDWKAVDRLEIVAEHDALTGKEFWFDNIHITNQDTALVRENSIISSIIPLSAGGLNGVELFPNPMNDYVSIKFVSEKSTDVLLEIYNFSGKKIISFPQKALSAGNHFIIWKGTDASGYQVPNGIYLVKVSCHAISKTHKLIINH